MLSPLDARDVDGIVRRTRDGLAALGATCIVEHAPPAAGPGLDMWGDVGPAIAAMRRLKQELDPAGSLNPGRYVGGI
jgi:glycolate oxidase FAD binding subunit